MGLGLVSDGISLLVFAAKKDDDFMMKMGWRLGSLLTRYGKIWRKILHSMAFSGVWKGDFSALEDIDGAC